MHNMRLRTRLTIAGIVLFGSCAFGQYVEDSMRTGRFVRDFAYNYVRGYMIGISWESDCIFSIRCATNNLGSAVSVQAPLHVTYNAISNRVYCTHGDGVDDSVMVARGTDVLRLGEIDVPGAWRPLWDSVSNRVYVACGLENDVAVIDCETDSVIARIPTGETPTGLELNTRRRKLYVRNWDGESVSIIDIETNQVVETLHPGSVPMMGVYCEQVDKYYLGMEANEVVVVDGAADSIRCRISTRSSPEAMVCVPSTGLLLVGANAVTSDSVYAIDTSTDSIISVCHLSAGTPTDMLWSSTTNLVYCACYRSTVAVLPADGAGVLRVLPVGDYPTVLAAAPEYGRVYVGHSNGHWVYVIKDSVTGIAEEPERTKPVHSAATLTRGRLRVAERGRLYDTGGRQVCLLQRGDNDVRYLAPGVYTVHTVTGALSRVVKVR